MGGSDNRSHSGSGSATHTKPEVCRTMNDSIWVVAESAAQTRFPSPLAVSSTTGRPLANAVTADNTESLSAVGLLMSGCPLPRHHRGPSPSATSWCRQPSAQPPSRRRGRRHYRRTGPRHFTVDAVFNYPTFAEAYKVSALDVINKIRTLS